jgi:hypothetical protein
LAAAVAALLLGEAVLRWAGQSYYWALAKRPDPVLGWRPEAAVSAWQRFEGGALIETNGLGFRDRDHAPDKPDGQVRIAVLGDSFSAAVQVPLEETWWRVLEGLLHGGGCGGHGADIVAGAAPVEVLSFAVSGYSPAQSLLAFRHEARRFAPDLVLLELFVGNDLIEGTGALDDESLRPYLVLEDGQLVLDDRFVDLPAFRLRSSSLGRAVAWLTRHSRILQTVVQARHALRGRARDVSGAVAEPGVDSNVYREPVSEGWRSAWSVTEAILATFAEEVRGAGAEPLLLIAGTGAQVHPDAQASAAFARHVGVPDLGYPVRRLLSAAFVADLPAVNLPLVMAGEAERSGVMLHGFENAVPGFGHWNADGHRVVANAAAEALCREPRLAGRLQTSR